jgi:hypothetical protein
MQKIVAYNEKEVKESGSKEDIKQGYNIWIDLAESPTLDPLPSFISL